MTRAFIHRDIVCMKCLQILDLVMEPVKSEIQEAFTVHLPAIDGEFLLTQT